MNPSDLIYPVFIKEGLSGRQAISSLPGQFRHGLDAVANLAKRLREKKISKVLLFGIPDSKDEAASAASNPAGIVQNSIRALKERQIEVYADVCLCQYTPHGQCRILENGVIDDEKSLRAISEIAGSYAEAGADYVAPSACLDAQVAAIRHRFDDAGFTRTRIMSYSAKFRSSFYGPFRNAVESNYSGGLRDYQLPPSDRGLALARIRKDVEEGADAVIVKPALPYLDIIMKAKKEVDVPVCAFQVSGEFTMLKSLNDPLVFNEAFSSMKAAGADLIISYNALK